jgi:hypothetical protein
LGVTVHYEGDNDEFIVIPSNAKISGELIEFHLVERFCVIPAIIPLQTEKELLQLADFWAANYQPNMKAVKRKLDELFDSELKKIGNKLKNNP